MSKLSSLGWVVAAACCGAWSAGATAAEKISREFLERMPAAEQIAYIKAQVDAQRAPTASGSLGAIDSTPPTITAFKAGTKINLGLAQPAFKVNISAQDDLSGVESVKFYALGPSGQYLYGYWFPGIPSTSVSGLGGISPMNDLFEPGTYTITFAYVYDNAGNATYYPNSALAAMGNTVFTVINNKGFDITPPTLVSGKITTPVVSLSTPAEGTADVAPFIGMKLTIEDTGNTALAGVRDAYAYLCLEAEPDTCIKVSGWVYATGQASVALTLRGQVSAADGVKKGTYVLNKLYVTDQASNFRMLQSTVFGGTTDFSTLFPATQIKVKP